MASVVVNGDTSGAVTLTAPAVAGTVTVTLPSTSGTMLTTASTTGISGSAISSGTVPEAYGGTGTSTGYYGFKNRIINGAMQIFQRNTGTPPTITTGGQFALDRWKLWANSGGGTGASFTVQQSTNAPAGFATSMLITQTAAAPAPTGVMYNMFAQYIEGYNAADLNWGSANAKSVVISFWVRSSVTGAYGGVVSNANQDRSYPFSYTVSVANTWEQKTITVPGDTSGTWETTTGIGIAIFWGLGVGSTYLGTAGAWAGATYLSATGSTNIVTTNGATLYITGVQLEKGSTATSFDYRPYGTEFGLCQAYYQKVSISGRRSGGFWIPENLAASNSMRGSYEYPVTMRTAPTGTITQDYLDGGYSGKSYTFDDGLGSGLSTNKAVLFTDAYYPGGTGNYGTFALTVALSAEL